MSEDILKSLPSKEDDHHEYKSSKMPQNKLGDYLQEAASAFLNSGGGMFVAGVDDRGIPDGGISRKLGRQALEDWVDQVMQSVEPAGKYTARVLTSCAHPSGEIGEGKAVLIVEFEQSHLAPHMAGNGRYYIRAGTHTVPARSFIVESLWARRGIHQPRLLHTLRIKPDNEEVLQLCVLAVTSVPALDVIVNVEPQPEWANKAELSFPLRIPLIDREHPLAMDISTWVEAEKQLGEDAIVYISYRDQADHEYTYSERLYMRSYPSLRIGDGFHRGLLKSIREMKQSVDRLAKRLETYLRQLNAP